MSLTRLLLAVIALMGLSTVLVSLTASHALYVEAKAIVAESDGEPRQRAESLAQSADSVFLLFGVFGAIQLVCGLACFRRLANRHLTDPPG